MAGTAVTDLRRLPQGGITCYQYFGLTVAATDILCTLFPYLSVADFLSLTSACKAFAPYRLDPTFWRTLTESTFRIPSQPLLQGGGARWQWLYKRLLTQTQLYTWGNNDRGSLGLFQRQSAAPGNSGQILKIRNAPFPQRVDLSAASVGIVADVQCGGWSTTLLNSIGVLYLVGNFNGLAFHETGDTDIKQLVFPAGYPPTTSSRYESSTAIREFSTGRNHVLGLADDGKVWYWAQAEARQIKLSSVSMTGRNVVRAVAGWDRCSLYIKGTGILYWPPPKGRMEPTADTLLIEPTIIPGTGHIHNSDERTSGSDLASQIGEVSNHIVLEAYVVFTTRLNKIFAWSTSPEAEVSQLRPFELTTFYPPDPTTTFHIRDVQGSFRSFALFTTSGAVLTANRPLLDAFFHASTAESPSSDPLPHPSRITSLQDQSVTSLAFGDHHAHALHDDGTISSFGRDPQKVGAFGLGSEVFAWFRGMQSDIRSWDGSLDGRERRTIWFEPLMETWMEYLFEPNQEGGVAREEDSRRRLFNDNQSRVKYGDYFEAEGRRWEDGVTAESEMGAYFALKVAAAGWHSAALVLVDEEKAERARQKHIAPPQVRSPVKVDQGLWSSLLSAVVWSLEPLHLFGTWLMGFLVVRSKSKKDDDRTSREGERKQAEKIRYVWENQPLPRFWDIDG